MSTIECPISIAASRFGKQIAIIHNEREISYNELDRIVTGCAAYLEQHNFEPEDCLAFQSKNHWEAIACFFACFRQGVIACPISYRLPVSTAQHVAQSVQAKAFVLEDELVRMVDRPASTSDVTRVSNQQLATIIFSSGSTGTPKAVAHHLGGHLKNAEGSNQNIRIETGDRWLLSLPLFHVGGLAILFRCFLTGATVVLDQPSSSLARLIPAFGITHVSLVATQLKRLIHQKEANLGSTLKAMLLGGSAFPPELITQAYRRGLPLYSTYGLSEMGSQVTTTRPHASLEQLLTSGMTLPFRECRIDAAGEILVRGETLFCGYRQDGKLDSSVDADGWFHTKDQGTIDSAGNLAVSGRLDNMIISGGENIHPEEIENHLLDLADVDRAIVVGIRDAEFGMRPVAFVDGDADLDTIERSLRDVLPKFKVPSIILPWPAERSNVSWKPNRDRFVKIAEDLI